MRDTDCVSFLRWALPRLELRWRGFRKVRRQVCRRIGRRLAELGLSGLAAYRDHLEGDPGEWGVLDALCRIPISRFFRDHRLFERLRSDVLPRLARTAAARGDGLGCWSAGCASGEEPYTLAILWKLRLASRFPGLPLYILATDADPHLLQRAQTGRYSASSLREVPAGWREEAFTPSQDLWAVRPEFLGGVRFRLQDVRREMPDGPFHLVFCRSLAFTYFEEPLQRRVLGGIIERLVPEGVLAIGRHESLPEERAGLLPCGGGGGEVLYTRPCGER